MNRRRRRAWREAIYRRQKCRDAGTHWPSRLRVDPWMRPDDQIVQVSLVTAKCEACGSRSLVSAVIPEHMDNTSLWAREQRHRAVQIIHLAFVPLPLPEPVPGYPLAVLARLERRVRA